jgi:hypothetical protein
MSIYLIVKNEGDNFGKPVNPRDIVTYRYTLEEAQEEHKIRCIAEHDLKAYSIRGPYKDGAEIEAFHMIQSGMVMLSAEGIKAALDHLGYCIRNNSNSFNYFNGSNERSYKARSCYITEKNSGLSFANINARKDAAFKALQELRFNSFGYENARIWEL